jgi:hypothetical protein
MAIYIKYSPVKWIIGNIIRPKKKGPEGPRGFSINLPKGGIQAYAKGVKKATWVF